MSGRLLLVVAGVLAVLAVAAHAATCTAGSVILALTGGIDTAHAYATCFSSWELQLSSSCQLTIHPAAEASAWSYPALWSSVTVQDMHMTPCPTGPLSGGTVNDESSDTLAAAISAALSTALFPGAVDAVTGVTFKAGSGIAVELQAPSANTLTYSAVQGALGPLSAGASACSSSPCAFSGSPCPAGRRLVAAGADQLCALCPPGAACDGNTVSPVTCGAGSAALPGSPSCSACPPGSHSIFPGLSTCIPCPSGTFQDGTGSNTCHSCPDGAYAHLPGSSACVACFWGKPVALAGKGAVSPDDMPAEVPSEGYMMTATSAGSPLASCVFNPFASTCSTLNTRTVAVRAQPDCTADVFITGDSLCSSSDALTTMPGLWVDADTLLASAGAGAAQLLRTGPSSFSLTFFQATTAYASTSLASCSDSGPEYSVAACPNGTKPVRNPQSDLLNTGWVLDHNVFKASSCAPCQPGTTCSDSLEAACAAGSFTALLGASSCDRCPIGTTSDEGATSCVQCPEGNLPSDDSSACVLCPPGKYSTEQGAGYCLDCDAGSARAAGADNTSCSPCLAGTYSPPGSSECLPCSAGTATSVESTGPDDATGSCPACPAGSYADHAGAHFCSACPAGSFSAAPKAASCTACGGGRITVAAGTGGATSCVTCRKGTYKPADASNNKCIICPAGYETLVEGEGASSCTQCRRGFFSSAANSVRCAACPPGSIAAVTGSRVCTPCGAGYVTGITATENGATGVKAPAASRCDACRLRTYRTSPQAANACVTCPPGHAVRVTSGATTCTPCAPGTTLLLPADATCTPCSSGTFAASGGLSGACTRCPAGQFSPDAGNDACTLCQPGEYQPSTGSSTCLACPTGTFNANSGGTTAAAACKPCPKGSSSGSEASDACDLCARGSYQDTTGASICKPCPAGASCRTGAIAPTTCMAGYASAAKSDACKPCAAGTYQPKAGQATCLPCPPGSYCPGLAQAQATACPVGTSRTLASGIAKKDCVACLVDTYAAAPGAKTCARCGAGQWTGRLTGQSQCWPTSSKLPTTRIK